MRGIRRLFLLTSKRPKKPRRLGLGRAPASRCAAPRSSFRARREGTGRIPQSRKPNPGWFVSVRSFHFEHANQSDRKKRCTLCAVKVQGYPVFGKGIETGAPRQGQKLGAEVLEDAGSGAHGSTRRLSPGWLVLFEALFVCF